MPTTGSTPLPLLPIAAIERDTGLSKDTLRAWERRYGYPTPLRDGHGERCYSEADLERLRVIKALLDAGHRPGRIVALPLDRLRELPGPATRVDTRQRPDPAADGLPDLIDLIRHRPSAALRSRLGSLLAKLGLLRLVTEVIAPLNQQVGEAWLRGELEVYEEHLYTEAVQSVLRQAVASIPEPTEASASVVLLTTVPGEPHGLGLLMAEAVFALEGCRCQSLGVQTPLDGIVAAARTRRVDIVALSFSACPGARQVHEALVELREKLPESVRLWAGGSAPALRRRLPVGVEVVDSLSAIRGQLATAPRPLAGNGAGQPSLP